MIHLLPVSSEMSPALLRKEARKLAMQGGYELVLADGVPAQELERIAAVYLKELESYAFPQGDSRWRSNIAARVLALISSRVGGELSRSLGESFLSRTGIALQSL